MRGAHRSVRDQESRDLAADAVRPRGVIREEHGIPIADLAAVTLTPGPALDFASHATPSVDPVMQQLSGGRAIGAWLKHA